MYNKSEMNWIKMKRTNQGLEELDGKHHRNNRNQEDEETEFRMKLMMINEQRERQTSQILI